MSERMERPWALMRHHAGWADVFHIETESNDSITRLLSGPRDGGSAGELLGARGAGPVRRRWRPRSAAAREGAVAEWRKHDAGVRDAEAKLREAERAREDAWLTCLRDAAKR